MARKALIQLRRDTSTNWTSVNPTLASGEIGYETDFNRFKVGDGTTPWNTLTYTSAGGMGVGTTPPLSPTAGTPWFNTNDGTLYVYYTDANSSQWVQVKANSALEASILSRLGSLESQAIAYGAMSPNYIINGAFDIWQRGTSFTSTSYGADRWYSPITNTTVSQETSDLPAGFQFGIKFVTTAANGFAQFNQPLETANVIPLRGKTVTISGWIKISGSYTGNWISQALFSTSSDAYASQGTLVPGSNKNVANSSTTSWTRFTNTFTVPSNAVGMRIENIPDSVQPSGVTVRMTGIQLEVGSVATAFRRNANSIQGELAACQRYFWRWTGIAGNSLTNVNFWITDRAWGVVSFPVTMRVDPSINWSGTWHVLAANSNISLSNVGATSSNVNGFGVDVSTTGGVGTQNLGGTVRVNVVSGSSYVQASAEL